MESFIKNDNDEKNNYSKIGKINFYLFYFLVLVVLDIIAFIFFKGTNFNLFKVIFLDLAIGLFLSFLFHFKNKFYRIALLFVVDIAFIIYALIEVIEIFTKISFDNTYTIRTIIHNYKDVLSDYSDEIINIINSHPFSFLLIIFFIIVFIIVTYKIYVKNDITISKKESVALLISSTLLFSISFIILKNDVRGFEQNLSTNGLKFAIIDDLNVKKDIELIDVKEDTSDTAEFKDGGGYNILDIDFDSFIENEDRVQFNNINKFIKNRKPTNKNDYTGLFKGKNLIMICAEAWNSIVVDEELFPAMYRLINNGFTFKNFYQPHGSSSTSSGEYAFMTGMIPVENDRSFLDSISDNMGFTVSCKFKEAGYNTYSFHNGRSTYYNRDETHLSHMGFDSFMANDTGLNAKSKSSYTDDEALIKIAYDEVDKTKPYLMYMMTYNGHMPYAGHRGGMLKIYYDIVDKKYGDYYTEPVKHYIAKNLFLEKGLEYLLDKLKEDGALDDTVICMVPDHYPYGLKNANQFTGENTDYVYDLYRDDRIKAHPVYHDRTDLILWSGALENEYKDRAKDIEKYCCTIDVTPTILNLFDIDFDSRIYPGKDIFSNSDGIVIYQDGQFITKDYLHDDLVSYKNEEEANISKEVNNLINYCRFNLHNDYYGYLMGNLGKEHRFCYLTFDGGPSERTKEIVQILNRNNVKATFFVFGENDLSYTWDLVNAGHKVGILSDTKDIVKLYSTDENYINDLNSIYQKLYFNTSEKPLLIRFPGGSGNTITNDINKGIMTRAKDYAQSLKLTYFDWNVDSGDILDISKDEIVNNVLSNIGDEKNICILFHDEDRNVMTVEALPEIIAALRRLGFEFKYLSSYSHTFRQQIVN